MTSTGADAGRPLRVDVIIDAGHFVWEEEEEEPAEYTSAVLDSITRNRS